ncbi:MAG: ABC transporter permease [Bacteroidales bacterium]
MIRSYFRIALRNIVRYRTFSFLNILGLTIGIMSFMTILLFIQHELSYNRHINDVENKYRVVEIQTEPGVGEQHVAVTMGPLAPNLVSEYPEVVNALRIYRGYGLNVKYNDQTFIENHFAFADSSVFDMMDVKLIMGDENTVFQDLNSIILSRTVAKKYFGNASKAMDKMLTIMSESFIVRGIMEDYPETSTVYFNALLPFKILENRFDWVESWGSNSLDTYVQLAPGTKETAFESKLPGFIKKYLSKNWEHGLEMYLQPMEEIHLKSGHIKFQIYNHHQGDINQLHIFSVIALLILIVACINYINLATSMALKRTREVGVRKVLGANRKKLIMQFLGESYILSILSAILAIFGLSLLLPVISKILGIPLVMDMGNPLFTGGLIATIAVVGLLSGLYPALYISGFEPTVIFTGLRSSRDKSSSGYMRKILVVAQFSVSVVIIISTLVAMHQVRFFQTTDKGYNDEAVYAIPLHFDDDVLEDHIQLLKNELKGQPGIRSVSASSRYNGVSGTQSKMTVADTSEQQLMSRFGFVDENYFPQMEIPILQGRNFSSTHSGDRSEAVILNEIAMKKLGWDSPNGKYFIHPGNDSLKVKVIGVIRDYNYYSLRTPIEPAAYFFFPGRFRYIMAKLETTDLQGSVGQIKQKWNELFSGVPFEGFFVDERYRLTYADEINTMKIFGIFAVLCIFISCLGLFGLISFVVLHKYKEIAIRKVFGSNVTRIVRVISREFLILILISSIIGIPVAYFYMDQWLNNFAYKISLSWYYFAAGIAVALAIAFLTMVYKIITAANANPAESLRYE